MFKIGLKIAAAALTIISGKAIYDWFTSYDSDQDWVRSREGHCYRIVPPEVIPELLGLISQLYKEADRIKTERKINDYNKMSEEEYEKIYKLKKTTLTIDDIIKSVDCIVRITKVLEKEVTKGILESFTSNYSIYGEFVHLNIRDERLLEIMGQIEGYHENVIPKYSIKPT